jgi:hypothetical protein
MPLRPVSELGLVDVTDLGSREDNDTPTRRPQREPRSRAQSGRQAAETDLQLGRPGSQAEHKPPVGRRPPRSSAKNASSSTPETSSRTSERRAARAPRKSPSAGASGRHDATRPKSSSNKPMSPSASTPRTSKRSGSESKPPRRGGSGRSAKSGSPSAGKHPTSSGTESRSPARGGNATSMSDGKMWAGSARWRSRQGSNRGSSSQARVTQRAVREGSSYDETKRSVVVEAGISMLGAAIGIAGAFLVGRSVLQR